MKQQKKPKGFNSLSDAEKIALGYKLIFRSSRRSPNGKVTYCSTPYPMWVLDI